MAIDARPAVFLDRDGVINKLHYDPEHGTLDSPRSMREFQLTAGAVEALRMLYQAHFPLVVVSNQPGVAKGTLTLAMLHGITSRMVDELAAAGIRLAAIHYCLHHPQAQVASLRVNCACRKPEPGLIHAAARRLNLSVRDSWLVGDGVTDIQAAHRAGCRAIWVGRWKCEHCQIFDALGEPLPDTAIDVLDAARHIIESRRNDEAVRRLGE
jgi:D-glycero-D-manno-heptose 1,7-bisphosphate phosphatase